MKRTTLSPIAIAVAALLAAPVHAEDLMQIYREAQDFDAQFASAKAALDAGREKLPQGRALLLPTIGANANWFRNYGNVRTIGVDGYYNSWQWNVQLTQPLFRWQNIVQYQQSELSVMQSEAQFGQATQDFMVRVAQAYFDVLAAQDNVTFIQAQKKAIGEQLAQAKRNFEVGTATITDTNEAQARFDLAGAQEIAALNDLEVKRQALQQVVGRVPEKLSPLRSDLQIQPPSPSNMDEWVKAAQENNYNVKAQEAAYEIAKKEVERQRAGHYPTVDLVGNVQRSNNANLLVGGLVTRDVEQAQIGVQVALPIFAGGSVLSRTRESASLAEKAKQDLENTRRVAQLNSRSAYLSFSNGLAQVQALEQAVKSSEVSLQSNKVGYEVGVRINIDVLNAEQQLTSARRDLSKARYDTILNGFKLKAAAGSLTEEDLQRVNALLQK